VAFSGAPEIGVDVGVAATFMTGSIFVSGANVGASLLVLLCIVLRATGCVVFGVN
jgi:hypothetical protein